MSEEAPPQRKQWRRLIDNDHLGLALTLAYLLLSAVGMLHRALVFFRFRINVIDYAEPSDFLMAALSDPLIVLASIAPLPLVWVYFRGAQWLRDRLPNNRYLNGCERGRMLYEAYRTRLFVLTVAMWAIAFSMQYARRVGDDLRAGRGRRVQVDLLTGSLQAPGDTARQLLIGTTQKYLFLYDDRTRVTSVVPTSNIARVRYLRPLSRSERRDSVARAGSVPAP